MNTNIIYTGIAAVMFLVNIYCWGVFITIMGAIVIAAIIGIMIKLKGDI